MAIQGLNNNNLFNLSNIRTLVGGNRTAGSGGSFSLGRSNGSFGLNEIDNTATGGSLGLGDVSSQDPNVSDSLNSVVAENALQEQFQNQLALINLQERVQSQSRTTEILTNILKSRHDAALSAARNLK
ncbi:MAG: hypothetical protein AB1489_04550 [Acidobacteriota bacterium]